jgi:hypothetical protein
MKIDEIIFEVDSSRRSFLRKSAAAAGALALGTALGARAQSLPSMDTDFAQGKGDINRTAFGNNVSTDVGNDRKLTRYRNFGGDKKFIGVDQQLTDRDTVGAGIGGGGKHGTVDFHAQHNFDQDGKTLRGSVEVDPANSKNTRLGAKLNIPF